MNGREIAVESNSRIFIISLSDKGKENCEKNVIGNVTDIIDQRCMTLNEIGMEVEQNKIKKKKKARMKEKKEKKERMNILRSVKKRNNIENITVADLFDNDTNAKTDEDSAIKTLYVVEAALSETKNEVFIELGARVFALKDENDTKKIVNSLSAETL